MKQVRIINEISKRGGFLLPLFLFFISSCQFDETPPPMTKTPYEFHLPEGVPLPIVPEGKEITAERVAIGKKIFYDTRLSSNQTISCASCHLQSAAFADHNPVSVGVEGRIGFRNSPTLTNVGYHPYYFREGGNPSLESQAFGPIEEHVEMDFSTAAYIERIKTDEAMQEMSFTAFGRSIDNFVIVRALGAFQRTLVSANSPYDRFFYKNEHNALSESEKKGMELFFGERLNCSKCHGGFDFTNYNIENNGAYAHFEDEGLARITQDSADVGKFKIPTLRNIELTYPYMHNGHYATLEEVIEHYNRGGYNHANQSEWVRPLNLNEQEKSDLLAFLKSLTDWEFVNNPDFVE